MEVLLVQMMIAEEATAIGKNQQVLTAAGSNSPPTTPRSRSPSTHGMNTRSRSAERQIQQIRDTKEFMEQIFEGYARSQAKIQAEAQVMKRFKALKDDGLTVSKLNTHLENAEAHFGRAEMRMTDSDKKKFLGAKLEGYTLACFNELLPKSLTYDALVKGLREKRFGPTDRWLEMQKVTFNGTGSPVDYCREKIQALQQYDTNYTQEMAVEQFLTGMGQWNQAEEIRKHSYRIKDDPKKLETLKSYFLQIASMPQKIVEVNAIQEEKKCFECKKLGHLARNCPERRNGGPRRAQYNNNYYDRYNNNNNNRNNNHNDRERDDRCYTCDGRGHKSNVCPSNKRKNDTWKNGQRNNHNGRDERRAYSRERSVDRNGMNVERNERRYDDGDEGRKEFERGDGRSTKGEVPLINEGGITGTIEIPTLTKDQLKPILKESEVIVFADPESVNVNIICTSSS